MMQLLFLTFARFISAIGMWGRENWRIVSLCF